MFSFFSETIRDFKFSVRQLRKNPGFTTIAVLTLALGVGANTAIFSLMNAVLLRYLPISEPQQLVFFGKGQASGATRSLPGQSVQLFSYPFFREFRQKNQVFSNVAAIGSSLYATHGQVSTRTGGSSQNLEKINVELVSGSYFNTLGVNPFLGRTLNDADDQTAGGHPVAVASFSWWERRFSRNPAVIGSTVTIDSTPYTIVGVAPQRFFGVSVGQSPDLWIPLAMEAQISPSSNGLDQNLFQSLHIIARKKPGISDAQASANTNLLFHQILSAYLGSHLSEQELSDMKRAVVELTPAATGRSPLRRQFSSPLKILMAIVGLVLLIACTNVANLLLARATTRHKEIAVRMAVGARRMRLVRQLLAESCMLGVIAAPLGILLAWGATHGLLVLVSTHSRSVPLDVTPDLTVLAFTIAITFLTVLLFGVAPAFYATKIELVSSLKAGRGVILASVRNLLSRGFVVAQVAVSLMLLVAAGLFLRSLVNLVDVDPGFDKQNVLLLGVDPSAAGYHVNPELQSMMVRAEERVSAIPGIKGASFALTVFNKGKWSTDDITVPGRPPESENPLVNLNIVGSQYFAVMKMPLMMGRAFGPQDNEAARKVAVINETMAHTFFPGDSPLGRTFSAGEDADRQNVEVVGVVKDAKYTNLDEKSTPAVFYPHEQQKKQFLNNILVRYSGDAQFAVPEIRRAIKEVDANIPVDDAATLVQLIDDSVLNKRLVAQLSIFFGLLAAVLSCIGIYGLMSYGVARRTQEFGIRQALGAERYHVLWLVLRETLSLAIIGVGVGLFLSLVFSRLLQSLLFGLKFYDVATLAMATVAMLVVALSAGYLPARRATRVEPSVALRQS